MTLQETAPQPQDAPDLIVRAPPHEESYWDRHPEVERYRVAIRQGQAEEDWQVEVWLRPNGAAAVSPEVQEAPAVPPPRPPDLDLVAPMATDAALFARHPDVLARQFDLQVNDQADGAERRVRLWLART